MEFTFTSPALTGTGLSSVTLSPLGMKLRGMAGADFIPWDELADLIPVYRDEQPRLSGASPGKWEDPSLPDWLRTVPFIFPLLNRAVHSGQIPGTLDGLHLVASGQVRLDSFGDAKRVALAEALKARPTPGLEGGV